MMVSTTGLVALATALALAAPPPPPSDPEALGGYYAFGENREREPVDGHEKVVTGSIILPLGLLRTGFGAAMYVMAMPQYCNRVYGSNASDQTCRGLQVYGLVGVGMGGLMAVTGAVFLAWGLTQRSRHHRWMREHGLAVAPMMSREVRGLSFGFRF
ncbi:hypothetical protein [Nannocystis pusilla]|uniref:Uncharacterized protein n=1 Tax=Nannocystis pusilla TaxID=889268 RepID=A0ABS7TJA4_9BACT|nr:hypothetical protein [Nannocystis pusilla]MBZ5708197.1 hypothetical protein [Nannocystis pusilla]